jgi:hypothetical protein
VNNPGGVHRRQRVSQSRCQHSLLIGGQGTVSGHQFAQVRPRHEVGHPLQAGAVDVGIANTGGVHATGPDGPLALPERTWPGRPGHASGTRQRLALPGMGRADHRGRTEGSSDRAFGGRS